MSFPSLSLPSSRNPFLSHFFIPHRAFGSWLLSKGLLQSTSARFQKMKTRLHLSSVFKWLRLFVRYSRSTYWTKLTCRVPK
ncbi:unnamed protein product [Lactuca virosa]|uniref:Uncharacterized protein n=1 Tax=Lactuca virosa TaxID=75947 RepID=A0AAU9LGJ8_9ASTR|nr:unnamed protein product [Lactuca virosa]